MSVAYVVSRFPHVSETFILRELQGVVGAGIDVRLLSLFPPVDDTVHPDARRWVATQRRGSLCDGARGLAWWSVRRPARLVGSLAAVAWAYRRRPRLALRSLVAAMIAVGHARHLRRRPVTRVHAHYATYPALTAWIAHRLLDVPYSFTAHAHDLYVDQSFLDRLVADADQVVTISHYNARLLAAHGAIASPSVVDDTRTPVRVVRCGVDLERFAYAPRTASALGPVRALCVASLQEYKGHRHLLRALAIDPRLRRVKLDLVGRGELESELRHLAVTLAIDDRVRFLGPRTEPEVATLLEQAQLLVLPSVVLDNGFTEGVPVALMEAMASGVPVVATRVSGVPELVQDGRTGLVVPPEDPAALAAAIATTITDGQAVRERLAAARRLIEEEFDARESVRRMVELLTSPAAAGSVARRRQTVRGRASGEQSPPGGGAPNHP